MYINSEGKRRVKDNSEVSRLGDNILLTKVQLESVCVHMCVRHIKMDELNR